MAQRTCSIEDCGRPHAGRGYCSVHYQRWRRLGDAKADLRQYPTVCSFEDCERHVLARGWCRTHYSHWWKHGDPAISLKPPGAKPRESAVGYYAAHYRVYDARGKAAQHICGCGSRAAHWAYNHTDPQELVDQSSGFPYSLDVSRYVPMCVSCHRLFDKAHSR